MTGHEPDDLADYLADDLAAHAGRPREWLRSP
jgi:hypothetical protein